MPASWKARASSASLMTAGEIDQGARDGGDRDATPERAVRAREPAAPGLHARDPGGRSAAVTSGGGGGPLHEPEQMGRRAPAEHRAGPHALTAAMKEASVLGARWPTL